MRPTFRSALARLCLTGITLALAAPARAADTPEPAPPPAPRAAGAGASAQAAAMAAARGHIGAQRWAAALGELNKAQATTDPDWHNLMGYVLRKQPRPDLAGAQRHYDDALRLNPRHLGALAYSGELALMKGDPRTAEARLATLAGLCSSPCEALEELQQALARYRATGKP